MCESFGAAVDLAKYDAFISEQMFQSTSKQVDNVNVPLA